MFDGRLGRDERGEHEAAWYEYQEDQDIIRCLLCPQGCRLGEGRTGVCRVRRRSGTRLLTLNYGRVTSISLDPIEKKPLYHFHPGSTILSAGTLGCNLACGFCQNWQISQEDAPTRFFAPETLADLAGRERDSGNIGLAYTYSEPSVWWEYIRDTAPLVKARGLANVLVTNGYLNREPLLEILPLIDAVNMDLKGFNQEFYGQTCHGRLQPVLDFAAAVHQAGVHLELTTLVIPGYNDDPAELRALTAWIAELDPAIPLHLSRYFPQYRFTAPATPLGTLLMAYEIARERLDYVYLGNIAAERGRDTICPSCRAVLIRRSGFAADPAGLEGNKCASCGREIPVVV